MQKGNIAFLDDDDEFYPDKTKLQLDIFNNSREDLGLVYGAFKIDFDNNFKIKIKIDGDVHDILGINYIGSPSIVMVTKTALNKINGFDINLDHKEDIDLYYRISEFYKVSYTNEIVAKYNLHSVQQAKIIKID